MENMTNEDEELGSLAQEVRKKSLGQAKGIMIFIGVITLGANVFVGAMSESLVRTEIDKEVKIIQNSGQEVDMEYVEEIVSASTRQLQLISALFTALGVAFIVMGFAIYKAPVGITIAALILYLGGQAITAFLDPTMIIRGVLIKIIIVVLLVKSVSAAIAYQNEAQVKSIV